VLPSERRTNPPPGRRVRSSNVDVHLHRRAFERADHQLDELRDEHEQLKAGVATLVRSLLAKNLISREEVRQITDLADPSADA